jgi:hypothetical protein
LNQFVDPHQGLILLNTEAEDSCQKIPIPPFVEVVSEVTNNDNFSTFILAGLDKDDLAIQTNKIYESIKIEEIK